MSDNAANLTPAAGPDGDSALSIGGGGLGGRVSAAAIIFVALIPSSASGTSASSQTTGSGLA